MERTKPDGCLRLRPLFLAFSFNDCRFPPAKDRSIYIFLSMNTRLAFPSLRVQWFWGAPVGSSSRWPVIPGILALDHLLYLGNLLRNRHRKFPALASTFNIGVGLISPSFLTIG